MDSSSLGVRSYDLVTVKNFRIFWANSVASMGLLGCWHLFRLLNTGMESLSFLFSILGNVIMNNLLKGRFLFCYVHLGDVKGKGVHNCNAVEV